MSWFRTEISINLNADKEPFVFTLGQAFLVFLLSVSLGVSYFFYDRYSKVVDNEAEAKRLTSSVANLIFVPENEVPTIATVSDPRGLEGRPFFDKAVEGDKVLVFAGAKKAILYRPSADKIVEVMPFSVPEDIGGGES